jgi:hypothetical protein
VDLVQRNIDDHWRAHEIRIVYKMMAAAVWTNESVATRPRQLVASAGAEGREDDVSVLGR